MSRRVRPRSLIHGTIVLALFVTSLSAGAKDRPGLDPTGGLCRAAREGRCDAVRRILAESPGRLAQSDSYGLTALHWASLCGHKDILELLLAAGAPVDAPGGILADTPLYLAVLRGRTAVARTLLDADASVNSLDSNSRTPVHAAAEGGNAETLDLLLGRGGMVSIPDVQGLTPLHLACQFGHENAARLLIDHGADVRSGSRAKETPLHLAARAGHVRLISLLLDAGALIDATDNCGVTALHRAARCDRADAVSTLVSRGADIGIKDRCGRTPLDSARMFAFDEVSAILSNRSPKSKAQ